MNPGMYAAPPPKTKIPGSKQYQVQKYTPGQLNNLEMMIQKLSGGISGSADYLSKLAGGDQSMFDELEAPAYTAFQKSLGQIGSRFSHLGAQDSSYFENATAGAGAELAENLQSKRMDIRNQAIQSLLEQYNNLQSERPYESYHLKKEPKQKTDWGKIGGAVAGGVGGFFLGGPGGAAAGASAGSQWGSGLF